MASTKDGFEARSMSVFGGLGDLTSDQWRLDTQQGFKPGKEDGQDSSDEGEAAQPLEGVLRSSALRFSGDV